MKQRIIPYLWFDREALEAVNFYTRIFPDSQLSNITKLEGTPSGDCDMVSFSLCSYTFIAINAGPYFTPNPSVSFFVNFDPGRDTQAKEHLHQLWNKLSEGGTILMPLGGYPFSSHYGWIQDRFGLSWQLILTKEEGEERPSIIPCLLFANKLNGKAEEASIFYQSVFRQSRMGEITRYPSGMEPNLEGSAMFFDFMLEGQWFVAMDSGYGHPFSFDEGISLLIQCDSQAEVDSYWEQLSADPEAEQCGWLKDRYGFSWQISPRILDEMLSSGTQEQRNRVTKAFLEMKKFDIAKLENAFK